MSHGFDKSDWFFTRVQAIREALSDYEERTGKCLERILLPLFWEGVDEEQRTRTGAFAAELLRRLGESQTDWPQRPPGAEPRAGLNQKQVAQMIGMCGAAMTEVKKGTGSAATINRLVILAKIRGVVLAQDALDFARIEDNVLGMVAVMKKVVELIGGTTLVPLDEATHRCIRAALKCEAWHRARDEGKVQEEMRLASELLAQAGGGERDPGWLWTAFSDWAPVLEVVLGELDSVLNSEGF